MSRTTPNTPNDQKERRLIVLAAIFLALYCLILTLSPAVRARSWDVTYRWEHWLAYGAWLLGMITAHQQLSKRLPKRDPFLLPVAGLLSGWGLFTIWRLFPEFGQRQSVWMVIAFGVLILGFRLNPDLGFLRRYKYLWLTGGLILTALTLLLGTNPMGSGPRLWLGCCGIYLQPSEPLKLLLIIYLAAYFADRFPFMLPSSPKTEASTSADMPTSANVPLLPLLAPTLIMTGLTTLILLVQRDLGTASIFLILYAAIVYTSSGRRQILIITLAALIAAGLTGYSAFDLVRLRMEAWINPWLDPSGRSYQIVQSIIAVANGGLLGRGPGLGNPGLVPIPHSDFIFTAIAEESGLVGGLGLLLLIALLAQRGISIAINASNAFQRYLAAGLTAYLIFQSILIIGGNLRMLPLTGVTLPFVSYGGSSLVTSFISLLLLLLISSQRRVKPISAAARRPYERLGIAFLIGIAGLSLTLGWWAFYRGPDLLTRTDNPRRAISDRFVLRGAILDRNNEEINTTSGAPGEYERAYQYPDLSNIIGYTNKIYGQSGLEASMDDTLRGQSGISGLSIWWNHLLYGQPPPGLDIRTSLELKMQAAADELLFGVSGALVILNPETGEILAMASRPTFDAGRLEQEWDTLIQDQSAPLFNRATQGLYPVGPALGPLIMAESLSQGELQDSAPKLSYVMDDVILACAEPPIDRTWGAAIASGCPGAVAALGELLGMDTLLGLYERLGLDSTPQIDLEVESAQQAPDLTDPALTALGDGLRISPLQMALAVSTLSANGVRPAPHLVTGIYSPQDGWTLRPAAGVEASVLDPSSTSAASEALKSADSLYWESVSVFVDPLKPDGALTWYTAGTIQEWAGTPLVLVIMIEGNDPSLVKEIGRALLDSVLHP